MPGRVLILAVRIAAGWTLLSLLVVGFWVLGLELARRIGSRALSKPPGWQRYKMYR
jgi:hypothetical protein